MITTAIILILIIGIIYSLMGIQLDSWAEFCPECKTKSLDFVEFDHQLDSDLYQCSECHRIFTQNVKESEKKAHSDSRLTRYF